MKTKPFPFGAIRALLLALALAAPFASANHAGDDDRAEARRLLQRGEILPLNHILEVVQKRVPGDVIEVELFRSDRYGWKYEVKVLARSGRVFDVGISARNGEIHEIDDD